MPKIVGPRVFAETGFFPDEMPDVPDRRYMLARLIAREHPLALIFLAQPTDQLDCRWRESQLVDFALLRMRRWLAPKARLGVELRPSCLQCFRRPTTGKHHQPHAVGSDTVIFGQRIADRRQ